MVWIWGQLMIAHRFWLWTVLFLVAVGMVSAITISPLEYDINELEFDKTYTFVLTVINDESSEETVTMIVDPESYYLDDYISMTPSSFQMKADEKKNVKISLNVPSSLSPEQHLLKVRPFVQGKRTPVFIVKFTVPGEQYHDLEINEVEIDDVTPDESLFFDLKLENEGNVIARGAPVIKIYDNDRVVDTIGERSKIMIMPLDTYNFSVMYDPRDLDLGDYRAEIYIDYNNRKTETIRKEFSIVTVKDIMEQENVDSKTIDIGDTVDVTVFLQYEQPSDYRLDAKVKEEPSITASDKGTISPGRVNEIGFTLDTSDLEAGEYTIEALIEYGEGEKLEKSIKLTVRDKAAFYRNVMIFATLAIGIAYAISFAVLRSKDSSRLKRLNKRLIRTRKKYDDVEHQTKQLIKDITAFVDSSNQYLREKGEKYEFG